MNCRRGTLGRLLALVVAYSTLDLAPLIAEAPKVVIDGWQLEQLAAAPDIVTPVGVAFDDLGRLLVIESHTHQRPKDYPGPKSDRIRLFHDQDKDGQFERWSTFADGFQQAMTLMPDGLGGVYVVTRRDVHLLADTDGDGRSESRTPIVRLETKENYPHNGLSGIAIEPLQDTSSKDRNDRTLFLGLGENFGSDYRLYGPQGEFRDVGGAGRVFTMRPDGTQLQPYATGIWNPFGLCLVNQRLFCIDNDPDARPPCRLLDVAHGADYGFRFDLGRAGIHPLQAWDGELPGTTGMLCGTGEAPTAIVYHRGWLWVTSWGDHRIERFRLSNEQGALSATREIVVQGNADFRPTGIAVGPDGGLYFGDWVKRNYAVHGHGRLWRLLPLTEDRVPPPTLSPHARLAERVLSKEAKTALAAEEPIGVWPVLSGADRLGYLQMAHWEKTLSDRVLELGLQDPDQTVRIAALRYVAIEQRTKLKQAVAALLDRLNVTADEYLSVLATIDRLDRGAQKWSEQAASELLVSELKNSRRSNRLKAIALRLLPIGHEYLSVDNLRPLLDQSDPALQREAIRSLALLDGADVGELLVAIAEDDRYADEDRADAIAGLTAFADRFDGRLKNGATNQGAIGKAATRSLAASARAVDASEPDAVPPSADMAAWSKLLPGDGDAEAGRRVFFHTAGVSCVRCHRFDGRGNRVGPDLTRIGQQQSRERIIESILLPSREIAPRFVAWNLWTNDGKSHAGLRLHFGGDSGQESYLNVDGETFKLAAGDVERREQSGVSVMPAGYERQLTVAELNDLLTFLMQGTS